MRTSQLKRALHLHRDTKDVFKGVYSCNMLPTYIPRGKTLALIANTDPSTKPGQHWVAYVYTKTHVFFFDSYGKPPGKAPFHNLMKHRKHKRYFGRRIQGGGNVCGHYCLYFILALINNFDFACFGDDLNANDRYVRKFVKQHFLIGHP